MAAVAASGGFALGIDQAELEAELSRTRRRLEEWAASRQQGVLDTRARHLQTMHDQTAKMQGLQAKHQQLEVATHQVKQRVEREEGEVSTIQGAADTLLNERDVLQQRISTLKEALAAQQLECQRKEAECASTEASTRKKLTALRSALEVFSSRLGLEFLQGNDELKLVFSQVNPKQPSQRYMLGVRIQPDNTYTVTQCEPSLSQLPALLHQLNSSNDFAAFVKASRLQFQALAASS